jgi:hypothetical protein
MTARGRRFRQLRRAGRDLDDGKTVLLHCRHNGSGGTASYRVRFVNIDRDPLSTWDRFLDRIASSRSSRASADERA